MMRPDWMIQGSCMGDIWTTAKSSVDANYHRSVWTRIPVLDEDDGAFDWFSDYTTGGGIMMQGACL